MNIEVTTNSTVPVNAFASKFLADTLSFAGAATLEEGTILARDSVSLKLIPFVKGGGANENGIPKAVLTQKIVATGAGDISAQVLVEGVVRKPKLIILADGDATNVDAAVVDQLRDYGIVAQDTNQLAQTDK